MILPLATALVFLMAGLALTWRRPTGMLDTILFTTLCVLAMALIWWVFRSRLSAWVSPQVFLMAGVPVLVLLMSSMVIAPYLPAVSVAAGGESVDLSGDFLVTVDGTRVDLEQLEDPLLFVNFWATWCGPCRAEMPSMAAMYEELRDEGMVMLAVTDEDPETVRAYLAEQPYPFQILLDPEGQLFRRFQVFALPTTVVLNRERKVVLEHQGGYRWDSPETLERFRRFLAQ